MAVMLTMVQGNGIRHRGIEAMLPRLPLATPHAVNGSSERAALYLESPPLGGTSAFITRLPSG